ncbi:MAG: DUF3866 family protein [Armatimonadota bacterium]|jgi:hypothetical protein
MIRSRRSEVLEIREQRAGLTRLLVAVEGRRESAVNIDALTGVPEAGDLVLLNTTAVHLGLGTGGEHFVMANLSRPEVDMPEGGHIMKLRYTPGQLKVLAAEETASPHRDAIEAFETLDGMVVVTGSLHSMLAPIAAGIREAAPDARLAYVMTDGGALPLALSDTVHAVKSKGLVRSTVTVGHAFGGDYEAVNLHSGLVAAKQAAGADAAIVLMGPGGVGTGTMYGFTGTELGEVVNAAHCLGGRPVAALRISFADPRPRHRGVSHHTQTALGAVALASAHVAVPVLEGAARETVFSDLRESGIAAKHTLHETDGEPALQLLAELGIELRTMGRGVTDDRESFLAAAGAGILAGQLLKGDVR